MTERQTGGGLVADWSRQSIKDQLGEMNEQQQQHQQQQQSAR